MKKVVSVMIVLSMVLVISSAASAGTFKSWCVWLDDYAITTYPSGGAVCDYDGTLLCSWHIDDPATYYGMDYISSDWLDTADEPLVWISPASMYYSPVSDVDVPSSVSSSSPCYMIPQNIADAIGLQEMK